MGGSRTATLNFWRANFGLFRRSLDIPPLGGGPEGQRSPRSVDILEEGNLKRVGAGCLCAARKASLIQQRALARTQI